jgi:hypothetical protein
MTASADLTLADRSVPWSLRIGGLAFGVFWGTPLLGGDMPLAIALGLHGLSIATIAFGLIQLERSAAVGRSLIRWVGVALTIIGTFAWIVLLPPGLTVVGSSLWIQRGWRVGPAVLIVGSLALFLSYLLGARVGTEGAPDPSLSAALLFGSATILIPLGLVLVAAKAASLSRAGEEAMPITSS